MNGKSSKSLVISLCIICGVILFFAVLPFIKNFLTPLLTPQPEKYTELYFENHLQLPKKVVVNTPTTISATIHNLEDKPMTYSLEVYAQPEIDEAQKIFLATQSATLQNDQTKTFPIELLLPNTASMSGRVKFVFQLQNIAQSIHFWADVPQASASSSIKLRR